MLKICDAYSVKFAVTAMQCCQESLFLKQNLNFNQECNV